MWHLLLNGPGHVDTLHPLREGVTSVGRAEDNDLVLEGELVSRRHARLHVEGGNLRFEDLGSRNGSRVNGQVVQGTRALQPGDTVSLGENTLTVRRQAKASAPEQRLAPGAAGVRQVGSGDGDLRPSVLLSREAGPKELLRTLHGLESARAPRAATAAPPPPPGVLDTLVLLYRSAEALASAPSLQRFLELTVERLLERTEATTAVVLLPREGGLLTPGAVRSRGAVAQGEVPVSDAIVAQALTQGTALLVEHAREDARFAARTSVVRYAPDRVVCIPLDAGGAGKGALYVNAPATAAPEPLLDACAAVAHLLSAGLQRFGVREVGPDTPRLRHALERALAPADVERRLAEAHARPGSPVGLEDRPVTLLWAELAGFGPFAAQAGPALAGVVLGEFRAQLAACVFAHGGSVEGLLGEGGRALFGAPYPHGDDAVRAVRAALSLRNEWEAAQPGLRLRVGVHTGRALVGLLGPEPQLSLSAAGEGVEVAGLLAAQAAPGQVLISGRTLAAVGVRFDVVPLGERLLRAPDLRSAAFEVLQEEVPVETTR